MNAYELADKLESKDRLWSVEEQLMIDICNALRQQADQISALEANYKIQVNINEKALQYIDHLEQGLRASIDLNNAQAGRHSIK